MLFYTFRGFKFNRLLLTVGYRKKSLTFYSGKDWQNRTQWRNGLFAHWQHSCSNITSSTYEKQAFSLFLEYFFLRTTVAAAKKSICLRFNQAAHWKTRYCGLTTTLVIISVPFKSHMQHFWLLEQSQTLKKNTIKVTVRFQFPT